jgi:hypothetical protein
MDKVKEFQDRYDSLINDLGNDFRILDGKVLESRSFNIIRVSTSFYDSYVEEKGQYFVDDIYETELPNELGKQIKKQKPKEIKFKFNPRADVLCLSDIEFDGEPIELNELYMLNLAVDLELEYLEEVEYYTLIGTSDGDNLNYNLNIEKSDPQIAADIKTENSSTYDFVNISICTSRTITDHVNESYLLC